MLESAHNAQLREDGLDVERSVKIEQLLLTGLDHHLSGHHERAIDVWTRVLLLDPAHRQARAHIERARAAVAEQVRQLEVLVQTGVDAFNRGDVGVARSLLTSAMEQGGIREDAQAVLDRLDRLATASGAASLAPSDPTERSLEPRSAGRPDRHESLPESVASTPDRSSTRNQRSGHARLRTVAAVPFGLFLMVAAGSVVCVTVVQRSWDLVAGVQPVVSSPGPVVRSVASLPVPSEVEMGLARARRLMAGGRWQAALKVLNRVTAVKPEAIEVRRLRGVIQQRAGAGEDGELAAPWVTRDSR